MSRLQPTLNLIAVSGVGAEHLTLKDTPADSGLQHNWQARGLCLRICEVGVKFSTNVCGHHLSINMTSARFVFLQF